MRNLSRLLNIVIVACTFVGTLAAQQPAVQPPGSSVRLDPQLELARERFEFEKQKAMADAASEKRRYDADRSAKVWGQLATLLPILTLVLGFLLQSGAEKRKVRQEREVQRKNETRNVINRQLAELYYPVQRRLQKDDAVWQLWNQNQFDEGNRGLAKEVEKSIILPNHEEIIRILEDNIPLLRNSEENVDLSSLMKVFMRYERHIALYRSLRLSNDSRNPIDFGSDWAYPSDFEGEIDRRILQLELQAKKLAP
jgi:hypothetical protein